jgi:hypothetical protein
MTMAACVRSSSVPVRLLLVAGLMSLAVGSAAAQAPGLVHTGPVAGIGGNRGLDIGRYDNKTAPPAIRVVQGVVLTPTGTPIKGAMVYLQDEKTHQTRTMQADENGKFRFISLSFKADYKLWAQDKDKKSPLRPISSLDPKSELTRDLKIE